MNEYTQSQSFILNYFKNNFTILNNCFFIFNYILFLIIIFYLICYNLGFFSCYSSNLIDIFLFLFFSFVYFYIVLLLIIKSIELYIVIYFLNSSRLIKIINVVFYILFIFISIVILLYFIATSSAVYGGFLQNYLQKSILGPGFGINTFKDFYIYSECKMFYGTEHFSIIKHYFINENNDFSQECVRKYLENNPEDIYKNLKLSNIAYLVDVDFSKINNEFFNLDDFIDIKYNLVIEFNDGSFLSISVLFF